MNTKIQPSIAINEPLPPNFQPNFLWQNRRQRLWILLLALPIVLVMAFVIFQPIQVLPRVSLAPGYSFVDQEGKRFASEAMRGNLTLYTFSHSGCTAPCVSTSATLAALQAELDEALLGEIPLQFVTIFVDPERATPAVLKAFAAPLQAESDRWHFVTGDAKQLKQVIGAGFSTYFAQEANGDFTVDPVFVLVDGWGIVRATYRTALPDVAIVQRDLGLVAQEAIHSTGVNRYAYEAAHLFQCNP